MRITSRKLLKIQSKELLLPVAINKEKDNVSARDIVALHVNMTLSHTPPPPGATQPIMGVYFTALYRALASSLTRLLDHTQRCATVGRTPLNG
jgi:hypothetical protein